MIRCLVQREMMPLAATVIEAEANQLCWTTGASPSWRVCLYFGGP